MAVSTIDPNGLNVGQLGGTRNVVINGEMMIDQRNGGSSTTPTANDTYTLDRWAAELAISSKYSVQQSSDAPSGFKNSMLITSLSSYSLTANDFYMMQYRVEGFDAARFNWGSSNAKNATLSFWVKSSLTGTFGGAFENSANNRAYAFSYTINSANTWEYKTITVSGDQTGTWLTTNGIGIRLRFALGVGSTYSGTGGVWGSTRYFSVTGATSVVSTSGATWQLAGVQLEVGDTATDFEYESYGTTLQKCLRYYEVVDLYEMVSTYIGSGKNQHYLTLFYKETKRASPTIGSVSIGNYQPGGGSGTAQLEGNALSTHCRVATGSTNSSIPVQIINSPSANMTIDAEL